MESELEVELSISLISQDLIGFRILSFDKRVYVEECSADLRRIGDLLDFLRSD